MANAALIAQNLTLASTVTITASSAVADRPVSYLGDAQRWKKWRSATGTGDQWVAFDFGSAQSVQGIALVDWLAHAGGSITVQSSTDGASWTTRGTFTLASPNVTGVISLWLTSPLSARYWRIYFTNITAANAYVQLAVVVLGPLVALGVNVTDDLSIARVDPSLLKASIDGQTLAQARTKYHQLRVKWEYLSGADVAALRTAFETIGVAQPCLVATAPGTTDDETFYVRLDAPGLTWPHVVLDLWSCAATFSEVR